MTYQHAFTGSNQSQYEKHSNRRRSYVSILNTEHNSQHFRATIADFK